MTQIDYRPLSRSQVLIAMMLTSSSLLLVARAWMWIGSVNLMTLVWTPTTFVQGLMLALVVTLCSSLIYQSWPRYRQVAEAYMTIVITPLAWVDLVLLGVLPGFSEEILFRGVALSALGTSIGMVILTSVVFGVLHLLDLRFWPYGVWASLIGLMMAVGLLLTQNLAVPIVAHVITNMVAGGVWKYTKIKSVDPSNRST